MNPLILNNEGNEIQGPFRHDDFSYDLMKDALDIFRESEEYKELTFDEILITESIIILSELVNLNRIYEIKKTGAAWYQFVDCHNIVHEQRIYKNFDVSTARYDLKLWFLGTDNKPKYEKPYDYYSFQYDDRIYNTHFEILINKLVPHFFSELPDEILYLPFIDRARFRLFKIDINKFLPTSKYMLDLTEEKNNIIKIKLKLNLN